MKKRKKPELTADRIVKAAARHISRSGMNAFSMHRLAADFGVTTTALYYHFKNKNQLLEATAQDIVRSVKLPDKSLHWKERLKEITLAFEKVNLSYPGLALFLVKNRASPAALSWSEAYAEILVDADFDGATAAHAFAALSFFINPQTFLDEKAKGNDQLMIKKSQVSKVLSKHPEQFPGLAKLFPHLADSSYAEHYEVGLERLIAGIESEVKGRKGP